MPTVLITNYIDLGEHIDFGYPGIFGATDRMVGEVFPVSGNLPGGNQYYDRWQAWLYPGNSTGLAANGKMSPFFYTNYYKFIFTANEAIDIANQSEGAEEMMGIAKTFRALCYLDLARLYDALPAKAPERPAYETELEAVKGLTVPSSGKIRAWRNWKTTRAYRVRRCSSSSSRTSTPPRPCWPTIRRRRKTCPRWP